MLSTLKRTIAALGLKPAALALMPVVIRAIASVQRFHTCTRNGIRYRLDLHEPIDSSIFMTGEWERATCEFLRSAVKPDSVVIEVGANIGAHTLLLGKLAKQIFAFEPTQAASEKLRFNLSLNPAIKNVTVIQALVSNGEAPKRDLRHSWNREQDGFEHVSVPCVLLDEFAWNRGIEKVDLLKIDVDGYEYGVLSGATEILKRSRPTTLVELDEPSLQALSSSKAAVISLLYSLGYRIDRVLGQNAVFKF